ncbi:hypothetical protein SAMN05443377_103140 [Propionibacterium cyclohexanicum]|uniref:Uncharacterized protein n=1 Tax=Propionibacterium cyclohexanicum TaxID=64702 RepID=A0A1H9QIU5_9ACTN|nr:hypothetical protein [Propionibacterium cyclohexanicum]SER60360.1 hypothetical protein SAMN05443377_103140 [Propionibacterium cyclohexanicum]
MPVSTREWFAQTIDNVERIQPEEVRVYSLTADQLDEVKARTRAWASGIRASARSESTRAELHERIEGEVGRRRAERGTGDDPYCGII